MKRVLSTSGLLSLCLVCVVALAGCPGGDDPVGPVASFDASPTAGVAPLIVHFTDTSDAGDASIISRQWLFGDGVTSTDEAPSHTYTVGGTYSVTLTVTTSAGTDTATMNALVTVVEKTAPEVSAWPVAGSIHYGQPLAASTLSGGTASVDGTFSFDTPDTLPEVGVQSVGVHFTPADTSLYTTVSGMASVTVEKVTPNVAAWPSAGAIVHGQPLAACVLSGGAASVAGAFSFSAPETQPAAGPYTAAILFAPNDASHYASVAGTVLVSVDKASPTIAAWPVATAITFGQTLAASELSGGTASVAGSFAFAEPASSPSAGNRGVAVTFTPDDQSNYLPAEGAVDITVNKAMPSVITWPSATTITYGQNLGLSALLGGEASIAGAFSFSEPATVPSAGSYTAAVIFVPSEAANYASVAGTASVTVNKSATRVTQWPTAGAIIYGQSLASSTLTGGAAAVPGTFAFTTPTIIPDGGTCSVSVTFFPTDTVNYKSASNSISLVVNKATPTVTEWPTASAITYGRTLSGSTLSGGAASVQGRFAFTLPNTVPNGGTYEASVTFTPANLDNYETVVGTASVVVNIANPTVRIWPGASAIVYGQPVGSSTLLGGSVNAPGTFVFSDPAAVPDAVGSYTAGVLFTPTNPANYTTVAGTVVVKVGKATPTVSTWPTASDITYGQPMSASVLSGGRASVPGTFTFYYPDSLGWAGLYPAPVRFTPESSNYNEVVGGIAVRIFKTTPTVIAWPSASPISYGQPVAVSTLSGGTASTQGVFTFIEPDRIPVGGTYSAAVLFTPNDFPNYELLTGSVDVSVGGGCWFVKTGATGDGSSWASAFGSIQDAVDAAQAVGGGDVLVAAGTYISTTNPVVTLRPNVRMYGGFAGNETVINGRDWEANITIIDGQSARGCIVGAENTTVDGFTVCSGFAASGGGMSNNDCSPTITNCAFTANQADHGGAMSNVASAPTITNCTFTANSATLDGGAISNEASSPTIQDCVFTDNTAGTTGGGGMYNDNSECTSGPSVSGCTFTGNLATGDSARGGGMLDAACSSTISDCTFLDNDAYAGGGLSTASSCTIDNCTFAQNRAAAGGGLDISNASPVVTNCTFTDNTAEQWGGGAFVDGGTPTMSNCTFSQNYSVNAGGGLSFYNGSLALVACVFTENACTNYGGGMYSYNSAASTLTNCVFLANSAQRGGGMHNSASASTLGNCTFARNSASWQGSAMFNGGSSPKLTNCILWDYVSSGSSEIYNDVSTPEVVYSCVQGGYSGEGNVSGNPLFVDALNDDCRLSTGSPCINAGTSLMSAPNDILGVPRPQGAGYDMGAYEFEQAVRPVLNSLAINGGADAAMDPVVTLDIAATDRPTKYMASESSSFTGASWTALATAPPAFTLSSGVGTRTVYIKVANAAGVSFTVSDTIFLAPAMVSVDAGTFMMGQTSAGDDAVHGSSEELPPHAVLLNAYQLGKYEVTNKQYCDVLNWAKSRRYLLTQSAGPWNAYGDIYVDADGTGSMPLFKIFNYEAANCPILYTAGSFRCVTRPGLPDSTSYSMENHPVAYVTWYGAALFCNWLSEMQGLPPCYDTVTGTWALLMPPPVSGGYRLPTEAEWERAAAWDGSKHWIYGFMSDSIMGSIRCNHANSGGVGENPLGFNALPYTTPVGWYNGVNVSPNGNIPTMDSPSPVGAYDMSGNVAEWCHDWKGLYTSDPQTNPTGPSAGYSRILRGNGYAGSIYNCRSAARCWGDLYYQTGGIRVARSAG